MASIESVRKLPRIAALSKNGSKFEPVPEDQVLRPRGLVFAYKSTWAALDSCAAAFVELLDEYNDAHRPNGVCVLDQGFLIRRAFTKEIIRFNEHVLLHFFM